MPPTSPLAQRSTRWFVASTPHRALESKAPFPGIFVRVRDTRLHVRPPPLGPMSVLPPSLPLDPANPLPTDYALASQSGEVEADMALSKWYLCGSEGNFEKNEALAVTFAEKAASRSLPSAEFALGYYREVGINGQKDIEQAKRWYARVRSFSSPLRLPRF